MLIWQRQILKRRVLCLQVSPYSYKKVYLMLTNVAECIELAEMHSIEVDFPKTGQHVELNQDQMPDQFPSFMEVTDGYAFDSF